MNIAADKLLNELTDQTQYILTELTKYEALSLDQLNQKVDETSWSVLECIEHLNRYGDFYIPEIKSRIQSGKAPTTTTFRSGWLGNYFAKSMLPKEQLNKMKTFKSMNPQGSSLDRATLQKFRLQQNDILNLLSQAKEIDLNRTKTSISISKFIKLRLGDTFRVIIYHNLRHIAQANRVISQFKT